MWSNTDWKNGEVKSKNLCNSGLLFPLFKLDELYIWRSTQTPLSLSSSFKCVVLQRQETSACLLTKDHFVFRDYKEGMACREKMGYRGATGRTGYLEETVSSWLLPRLPLLLCWIQLMARISHDAVFVFISVGRDGTDGRDGIPGMNGIPGRQGLPGK